MLISRPPRQRYQFSEAHFRPNGRALLIDFSAARLFAEQMGGVRGVPVPASDINALGLIDEILHTLLRQYEMQNPGVLERAAKWLEQRAGKPALDKINRRFVEEFPPMAVYNGRMKAADYVGGKTEGRPNRIALFEEMLIVNVNNLNPAANPYKELFDDTPLKQADAYASFLAGLGEFFNGQPGFGSSVPGAGESLIQVLRAPALASPYSLAGQLEYLMKTFGVLLGESFVMRLLRGIDFFKEEAIRGNWAGGFGGDAPVLSFGEQAYAEYERFSPDKDWMPRCVLMAKNSYVWLNQLSRAYGRDIRTLDQIPDEELDKLAARGFTGLWLIGLWERSRASQRIKQMMGDHDAVASAYSLHSYDIATDLGGWRALENLRWRAWQRGMRLSADMVPNHMGIDSIWVAEHPDWFLSVSSAPYPAYSFNGPDLSDDGRMGAYLEDHYYSKTDAAVVFKRIDRYTGEAKYIYHGNDGTSMPWNDTAQLDYSNSAVREAVIQTILHVARNFPIIRFDAAMTLAKKHVQRLWFPEPGAGGAIPSRSEHGMTRQEFDAKVPEEFWREVVDRVAKEVPDTLLLAEAFWLMEGYFVRTLGMHRVYNSAFMHMLRDEDNAKYRTVIKNVLEFDTQVLKRFVNFMNNPDEKTAIEQFGNGEKYFGVATVLATLPGLPMFGHGQIEGFREKYGMEFRKPKWDETPDENLIRAHEWRIFPILHKRRLFAEVDNFLLYDFNSVDGHVNEDVFAYSNRFNSERGLVIYHNKYAETRGWVKVSAAYMDKVTGHLVQRTLMQGLALPVDGYVIFKDYAGNLEYIRPCRELAEKGLYVELNAYRCYAFLDFRFVDGEQWKQVHDSLHGAGVASIQAKWDEMFEVKKARPEQGRREGKKKVVKGKKEERGKKKDAKKVSVKKAVKKKVTARKPVAKKKVVKKPKSMVANKAGKVKVIRKPKTRSK